MKVSSTIVWALSGCLVWLGCGDDDGAMTGGDSGVGDECTVDTTYAPVIDPANFVENVDNPLYPLVPGTIYTYREGENGVVVITVTNERKAVLGVSTVVVHDVLTIAGEVAEDTYDWYAQDRDGAVWYFGEDTTEYRMGTAVSTEGSWEAGVDGAQPGIIIPANPMVGMSYRQEYYACEAEDFGEILSLAEDVTVPEGSYSGCLQTHDYTPLEPEVNEQKWYCPGVGNVLALDVVTGEREELIMREGP